MTKKEINNYGTINYTYDSNNNLICQDFVTSIGNTKETYDYDQYNRLIEYTNQLVERYQYSYDYDNRIDDVRLPDNTHIYYTYDTIGNVTNVEHYIDNNNYNVINEYQNNLLVKSTSYYNNEPKYGLTFTYNGYDEITNRKVNYNNTQVISENISRTYSSDNGYYTKVIETIQNFDNVYNFENDYYKKIKTTNINETTFTYDSSKRLLKDSTNIKEYHYNSEDLLDKVTYYPRNNNQEFSVSYDYEKEKVIEKRIDNNTIVINHNNINDCISDYTKENIRKNGTSSTIDSSVAYTCSNIIYSYSEEFMNNNEIYPLHNSLCSLKNTLPYSSKQFIDNEYYSKWFTYDNLLHRNVFNACGNEVSYKIMSNDLTNILLRFRIINNLNRNRYILNFKSTAGPKIYIDESNKLKVFFYNQTYDTGITINKDEWYYLIFTINREGFIDQNDTQRYNYTFTLSCNGNQELYEPFVITKNRATISLFSLGFADVYIGSNYNNESEYLAGNIEELIISNSALTTTDLVKYKNMTSINNYSTSYDINGRLTYKYINNDKTQNLKTVYSYPLNNSTNQIDYKVSSENINLKNNQINITYTYDNTNKVKSINKSNNLISYTYSKEGYLIKETRPNSSIIYDYDNGGNIIKKSKYEGDSIKEQYDYVYVNGKLSSCIIKNNNMQDEKTWLIDSQSTGYSLKYCYITNNLETGFTYEWNGRNLIKAIRKEQGIIKETINFEYNVNGRRTKKIVTDNENNVKTINYYYRNDILIREETTEYILDYIYDNDKIISVIKTTNNEKNIYYYITNQIGEIIGLVSSDGEIQATYEYDAYGKIESIIGNNIGQINSIRYKEYIYDDETSLFWLSSRYYSP